MKIVSLTKDKVKLKITSLEDIWYLRQVISIGDIVGKKTDRGVKREESQDAKRISFYAELKVEKIDYSSGDVLRISGKLTKAPDYVEKGYHTFNIKEGDEVILLKTLKPYEREILNDAIKNSEIPKVLLCVFDVGEAQFAILRQNGLKYLGEFRYPISRREKDYPKLLEKFYVALSKEIENKLKNLNLHIAVIGGFGPYADNFKKFCKLKDVFVYKVNNAGKEGIREMIKSGIVKNVLRNDRISKELELISEFLTDLKKESNNWVYGLKDVKLAKELHAIDLLLVLDELIQKKEIKELIKDVNKIMVFSSESPSGERLKDLGGILAKLKFKIKN